jgi:hypothetical protein
MKKRMKLDDLLNPTAFIMPYQTEARIDLPMMQQIALAQGLTREWLAGMSFLNSSTFLERDHGCWMGI